jgi:putative peptide zinc metalloprotease protein
VTPALEAPERTSPVPVWGRLAQALAPTEERPQVVAGIEAAHHVTRSGRRYVVVHNPMAESYLRLDPREFDLLALMDGTRTVKSLVVAYYQRHGMLALSRVTGLVEILRANRFLTERPLDAYAALGEALARRRPSRVVTRAVHRFLEPQVTSRNVDRHLSTGYHAWGRLLFTRPVALVGTAIGLLAPLFFLLELSRPRYSLFRTGGSYLTGVLILGGLEAMTLAIHEVGHGLAVKHAGRFVPKAGMMLYFGIPVAFVDTTDVWMAPARKRVLTSLAGPWTSLVLSGFCTGIAFLLPEGPVGSFLFAWGFVLLLNTLINFNPLLEMDGYYLLVDLTEKPMLRSRAFAFARGPLWRKLRTRDRLSAEERFFGLFGLASAAYSAFALFLGLRLWRARIQHLVKDVWRSGSPVGKAFVVLAVLALGGLLVLVLWGMLLRVAGWVSGLVLAASGKAREFRRREALGALRSVPLWAGIPTGRLMDVAEAMRRGEVWPGTEVVTQGELGDRFYVIVEGSFEVFVNGEFDRRLGPGDYFGERALIHDAPRAATVIATERGRVLSLGRDAFRETLGHDVATRARLEAAIEDRQRLGDTPLFADLSPTELDLLLAKMERVSAPRGTAVLQQGQTGERFYVVRSGAVEVERDGRHVAVLREGEAFGEISLLLSVPVTANVRALEDTELLALDGSDFRDLLVRYCDRASELEQMTHVRLEDLKRLELLDTD